MRDRTATALLALLLASAPSAAFACISMMSNMSTETFPLDFLWLGNVVAASIVLLFGKTLMDRKAMRRALVISSLIFGGGLGLFMSNTLSFELNFTAISALAFGFVLSAYEIRRSWTELAALLFILSVSALASADAVDDAARFEKYGHTDFEMQPIVLDNVQF